MSEKARNESTDYGANEHQQEEIDRNELSPGAQLSGRRQELNLSIEQIANQLNLAPRQIQAIESDNYAALPGMATARGFIRAYAKLLNVDAAPLLQAVARETTDAEKAVPLRRDLPAIHFTENRLSSPGRQRWRARTAFVMVLLVLLAGGLFVGGQVGMTPVLPTSLQSVFQFGKGNESTVSIPVRMPENGATDSQEAMSNTLPVEEKLAAGIASDPAGGEDATRRDETVGGGPINEVGEKIEPSKEQPVSVADTVVPPVSTPAADTKDLLTLKLREDSWIEIRRADNSVLVAALLKAGTTESFKIAGPVAMTVGNAAGVDVALRGKPVELKSAARSNVARLSLK